MALLSPASARYRITTADHGNYKLLGNVSESEAGFWRIAFDPDDTFVGSLLVTARADGDHTHDDEVGFGTLRYRVLQLNGVGADYSVLTAEPIGQHCIILVPSVGLSVALAVTCTAGTGMLYVKPFIGPYAL